MCARVSKKKMNYFFSTFFSSFFQQSAECADKEHTQHKYYVKEFISFDCTQYKYRISFSFFTHYYHLFASCMQFEFQSPVCVRMS